MFDQNSESKNWGLLSPNDNPYDGKSATINGINGDHGEDQWGYRTGGERKNCGDFLSAVKAANEGAVAELAAQPRTIKSSLLRTQRKR
jgi:hypothetical protein